MRDLWQFQSLVTSQPLGEDVFSIMRQASDPAEWSKKAHDFFNGKQYGTAKFCFERAGDRHNAKRSLAASLNQEAERCQTPKRERALYMEAAVVYEELSEQVQLGWGAGRNYGRLFPDVISTEIGDQD